MVYTNKKWHNEIVSGVQQERYFGKIQYLRQEHGYIRSKTKINGIRDVTFSYCDSEQCVIDSLEVGDQVSFRINIFTSGKFTAVDVMRESLVDKQTPNCRSGSPVLSIASSDSIADDIFMKPINTSLPHFSAPIIDDNSLISKLDKGIYSETCKDNTINPCFIPSATTSNNDKLDSLSSQVDSFLLKVISRNIHSTYSTCWLQF